MFFKSIHLGHLLTFPIIKSSTLDTTVIFSLELVQTQ